MGFQGEQTAWTASAWHFETSGSTWSSPCLEVTGLMLEVFPVFCLSSEAPVSVRVHSDLVFLKEYVCMYLHKGFSRQAYDGLL